MLTPWQLRLASLDDVPALKALIRQSVHELQAADYSPELREAALKQAFGVDRRLIYDGTYFVAEADERLVGCGGWSKRQATYGGDRDAPGGDAIIDLTEPARIRAFFIHPDYARRGIGRAILHASEAALVAAGFRSAVMVATLTGERLYATRYESPVGEGYKLPVVRMQKNWPADL